MVFRFKNLQKHPVYALDGEIGPIKDILFDDRTWSVRYISPDTNKWLPGKKVVLSPESFIIEREADRSKAVKINLTKKKIEEAPLLDDHLPVSRQYETLLSEHFSWEPYWITPLPIGLTPYPPVGSVVPPNLGGMHRAEWEELQMIRDAQFDGHLRSLTEITGYKIGTEDDQTFGEVTDVIVNQTDWLVVDLVMNSRKWMPGGKEFVCSPFFVKSVDDVKKVIHIAQTKEAILRSPDFDFATYGETYRTELVRHYCTDSGNPSQPFSSRNPQESPGSML